VSHSVVSDSLDTLTAGHLKLDTPSRVNAATCVTMMFILAAIIILAWYHLPDQGTWYFGLSTRSVKISLLLLSWALSGTAVRFLRMITFTPPAAPSADSQDSLTRAGFIGLIGRPNVGKSTLLNRLIGQKLAITANKPQTTRNRLLGIRTIGSSQLIFIDTPGIHTSSRVMNQKMVSYAVETLQETDFNLMLVEPLRPGQDLPAEDQLVLQHLQGRASNTILAINKIDGLPYDAVLQSLERYRQLAEFAELIPISALKSHNLERLWELLLKRLPENPFFFAEDQLTDASERFLCGELVREQLFRHLQQELPYSVAVQVESFEETPKLLHIVANIIVERESQKGIIIGHKGQQLKKIGTAARQRIETLLGHSVYLSLQVQVLKQWSRHEHYLQAFGME
jgi:GTP-binding protein Era